MNKVNTIEIASPRHGGARNDIRFNWLDNPDVQRLLDVICSIIADEYIEVVKRNKEVFGIASVASSPSAPPMTWTKLLAMTV